MAAEHAETPQPIDHDKEGQRFFVRVDGHEAVLDYRMSGQVMTITHTGVPAPISGQGVAAALMREALRVAHSSGWTVIPECSYAASYMRRHPQRDQRPGDSPAL